jgi:hypothetical protein
MSSFFYYLTTVLESGLSVFGVRAPYEQPAYQVIGHVAGQVEIRAYPTRTAVETSMVQDNDGEAFGKLFRYITGANHGDASMHMTAPVEQTSRKIAMTIPVEMSGGDMMRFFLPESVVKAGPPVPNDPTVHVITLPPAEFAALRFAGTLSDASRTSHTNQLDAALKGSKWQAVGAPSVLSYDPPFAIPFLRRNEIVVEVKPPA